MGQPPSKLLEPSDDLWLCSRIHIGPKKIKQNS